MLRLSMVFSSVLLLTGSAFAGSAETALDPERRSTSEAGRDFATEARLLMRVVACQGDDSLPADLPLEVIEKHCRKITPVMENYRQSYLPRLREILRRWPLDDAPETLVYPFGGGDLLSALAAFPRARLITTISLEHTGDPRRLGKLTPQQLRENLSVFFRAARGLLRYSDSRTESLMKLQQNGLAGELSLFLLGLAVHEKELLSVRFFRLEPDGTLHYLAEEEIERLENKKAKIVHQGCSLPPAERQFCRQPDFSLAFSNVEIAFRDRGRPEQPPQILRHLAADLSDAYLSPALLAYLENLGPFSAMTKAASYLLWRKSFSRLRGFLLAHMELMLSDSTGIPHSLARAAGFEQQTAGEFSCSFLRANPSFNKEFRELWRASDRKPLGLRFGYVDCNKRGHLLLTYKKRQEP